MDVRTDGRTLTPANESINFSIDAIIILSMTFQIWKNVQIWFKHKI